ncbi:NB-ARC domain-containing protein [Streptomyces albidoflavus]|uniref:NB-ARC domain-containing protein n=1 Tax=Streptomyces albidoflavus TaxID=1886 RepID=UPI0021D5E9D1|nr:NB-ARC domain-containing protein [Streptomyces albidoflavus]MCU7702867.1 NB-ARC domain-containing protein [Streptomyces albidoflavus]
MDGDDAGVGAGVWNSVSGGTVFGAVVQAQRIDSLNVEAPPQVWPPRQLPSPLPGFVNRTKERRTLRELAEAAVGQGVRTVVVTGLGGVGKTQLIAHCVRSDLGAFFPDGQVYVDLADVRRDGAVDVAGVLGDWLDAFGVPYGHQPAGLGGRADLFRTVTTGKRVLVVVDNVRQAPEIRALPPGDGLLVATSRTMLPALRMDGAVQLVVDPLDEREAIGIVRGRPVAQDEGPAAAELVRRCGGLPLALRAVGEWLVERPQLGLDDAVRSLAPFGGAAGRGWADEGTVDVMEQVFDSVLRQMPDHTRALYRFLGALPGTTFPAALPRAAGLPRVDAALGDLMTSHLVVAVGPGRDGAAPGGPPQRFRMHDLARAHAATEAATLPEEAARSLLRTVTDFYAEAVAHADRSIGGRFRLQDPPARSLAELGFAEGAFSGDGQGLDWLDAERGNILAVLRAAAREGLHDAVWRTCESLWPLFHERARHADSLEAHPLGIEAARWENRPDAEIRMRNQLARAHAALGDLDRAAEELRAGEPLLALTEDARLRGMLAETGGLVALGQGRTADACDRFTAALAANTERGDQHGIVVQSYHLAEAVQASGDHAEARRLLAAALGLARETGDLAMIPKLTLLTARVHADAGEVAEAVAAATDAAEQAGERGLTSKIREALELLLGLARRSGDTALAESCERRLAELRGPGDRPGGA